MSVATFTAPSVLVEGPTGYPTFVRASIKHDVGPCVTMRPYWATPFIVNAPVVALKVAAVPAAILYNVTPTGRPKVEWLAIKMPSYGLALSETVVVASRVV